MVKIKSSGKLLERSYSLLPFLREVAGSSDVTDPSCLKILLRIVNSTIELTSHSPYLLFEVLMKLKDKLDQNIGIETFDGFLQALLVLLNLDKSLRKYVSREFLHSLIGASEKYLGNVNYLRYLFEHALHSSESFNLNSSDSYESTYDNLRRLISIWHLSERN